MIPLEKFRTTFGREGLIWKLKSKILEIFSSGILFLRRILDLIGFGIRCNFDLIDWSRKSRKKIPIWESGIKEKSGLYPKVTTLARFGHTLDQILKSRDAQNGLRPKMPQSISQILSQIKEKIPSPFLNINLKLKKGPILWYYRKIISYPIWTLQNSQKNFLWKFRKFISQDQWCLWSLFGRTLQMTIKIIVKIWF